MRKRELRVTMNKVGKEEDAETPNSRSFEDIADAILYRLEGIGAKLFLGVCIYVVLDTYRQTQIEKVKKEPSEQ